MGPFPRPRIAVLVDPRFPGGTSSAVAHEILAMHRRADLTIHFLETRMFKGREINPTLQRALDETGLTPVWNAPVVRSDIVVFHNPSALKFDERLRSRILCDRLIVVTHAGGHRRHRPAHRQPARADHELDGKGRPIEAKHEEMRHLPFRPRESEQAIPLA